MTPKVIIFKTMKEFDRLMLWAAREKLMWSSGTPPGRTSYSIRAGVDTYLRNDGQCAICIEEGRQLGYAPVSFFRNEPAFNEFTFNTVQEILQGGGIDCTIPE